jgi:hypothetical protein
MAPEQVEGKPVDGRCDQYSLAILVWEALTGALPFTGDSVGELIRKHLLEPAPRLSDARPDIPANVSDAVGRAMSKNPSERFPDVAAFIRALGGDADRRVSAAFTSASAAATSRRALADALTVRLSQPRRRVLAYSVVAGIALLGGGIWAALQPSGPANGATPRRIADSVPQVAAPPRTVAAAARARLSLSTQPPGMVFVDGKRIRSTPVIRLEIAPGRHHVQVRRDGFAPFDSMFTAAPGQEIKWTRKTLKPIAS